MKKKKSFTEKLLISKLGQEMAQGMTKKKLGIYSCAKNNEGLKTKCGISKEHRSQLEGVSSMQSWGNFSTKRNNNDTTDYSSLNKTAIYEYVEI